MPSTWKTVRVFISSTFRDMHAERDHLIKVTFPALREKLLPHRVELFDIDLRWGITEDEAKNEKVIDLCLEQVDECRPFFLAFLGHRYGWVPGHIPSETQERFPFVRQFTGASVTELELRHGVTPNPKGNYTLVLLRKDEVLAAIPEATRKRDFVESDPELQQKLTSLRKELESGLLPVQPYVATWDPKRYDRVNRTDGRLHGLDDFGSQVEAWLWNAIKTQLQLPETPAGIDKLDAEADLHERFLESRTRIYVGRNDLYDRLCIFALDTGDVPLLISGASGLGKSAALAHFVRNFREQHQAVFVLPHFVGASPRTTSLPGMLLRLTQELGRKYGLTLPKAESPDEVIRAFIVAIASVPESVRVVLVIDALNQLDADSRVDSLIWLPEKLPANVRLLCSSATGPQKVPQVMTAFGERAHIDVPLRSLGKDERREIIKVVPKLAAKTLDNKQIDALLANEATANPLFLMVVLEELRGYGSHEHLTDLIEKLPHDGDALENLFDQVFERLEQEFNKPLVQRILCSLTCARRGLSERELHQMVRSLQGRDELFPVLRQLRPYLLSRSGLLNFFHSDLALAVRARYLQTNSDLRASHMDLADYFATRDGEAEEVLRKLIEAKRNRPFYDILSDAVFSYDLRREMAKVLAKDMAARSEGFEEYLWQELETEAGREHLKDTLIAPLLAKRGANDRMVEELPWQLAQAKEWKKLAELLADLPFFRDAWGANQFDVMSYWAQIEAESSFRMTNAYQPVVQYPAQHDFVRQISILLQQSGHLDEALTLEQYLIEHFKQDKNSADLAIAMNNRAVILTRRGDLKEALALHQETEKLFRDAGDHAGIATNLGNQGSVRFLLNDFDGAMKLLKQQEELCRSLNNLYGQATSIDVQGAILRCKGNFVEALSLHRKATHFYRQLNDPSGISRSLGNQALVLDAQGDLRGSMTLLQEQECLCRQLNDPLGLSNSLDRQSTILMRQQDNDEALRVLKELEQICRQLKDLSKLSRSLGNQAGIMQEQGDLIGAAARHAQAEELYRQLGDQEGLDICLQNQRLFVGKLIERAAGYEKGDDQEQALAVYRQAEDLANRLQEFAGVVACIVAQAMIYRERNDTDGFLATLKRQEELCRRTNDLAGLARSRSGQAWVLGIQGENAFQDGDMDRALATYLRQKKILEELQESKSLQICLRKMAEIYYHRNNYEQALALHEQEEKICRELADQSSLIACQNNQAVILNEFVTILRNGVKHEDTLAVLKKQQQFYERLNDPHGLERNLGEQAGTLKLCGRLDEAMIMFGHQENLCRKLGDAKGIAIAIFNRALIQVRVNGQPQTALPLMQQAYEMAACNGLLELAQQMKAIWQDVPNAFPTAASGSPPRVVGKGFWSWLKDLFWK